MHKKIIFLGILCAFLTSCDQQHVKYKRGYLEYCVDGVAYIKTQDTSLVPQYDINGKLVPCK